MLDVKGTEIPLEQMVATLASRGVKLPLNLTANFTSSGNTTRALAQNLGGELAMNADKGNLPYTDMLGNVSGLAAVLQGQQPVAQNGSGAIDSFNAKYTVRQGVMSTDTFALSTNNGAMKLNGEGTVNIGGWNIATTLTPTLQTGSNNLAVPVLIKGSLSAPAIGPDPAFINKLSGKLLGNALKGVIGNKAGAEGVGGVLGGIISGQGVTKEGIGNLIEGFTKKPQSAAEAASGTTPAPEKPINTLIKGFLGN